VLYIEARPLAAAEADARIIDWMAETERRGFLAAVESLFGRQFLGAVRFGPASLHHHATPAAAAGATGQLLAVTASSTTSQNQKDGGENGQQEQDDDRRYNDHRESTAVVNLFVEM